MKFFRSFTLPIAGLATMAMLSGCGDTANITGPDPVLDTTPPPAPQNLTLAAEGAVLVWSASAAPDVAGYQVYVYSALPGGGNDYVLVYDAISSDTAFELPHVITPVEATYRVRAVDTSGNWSAFSADATITIPAVGGSGVPNPAGDFVEMQ